MDAPRRRGAAVVWSSSRSDRLVNQPSFFGVSSSSLEGGSGVRSRSVVLNSSICSTFEKRGTLRDEDSGQELDVVIKVLEKDDMQESACLNNEYTLTTTYLKNCSVVRKAIKNSPSISKGAMQMTRNKTDEQADVHDGRHKLYLEWVDGITLDKWIATKKDFDGIPAHTIGMNVSITASVPRFLSLLVIVRLMREIAFAVAELHEAGVVHNDLVPENIIIRDDAEGDHNPVTLINLGFASSMNSRETDDYGETTNDDLYALGLVFSDVLRAWSDAVAPPPTPTPRRKNGSRSVPQFAQRISEDSLVSCAQRRQLSLCGTVVPCPEDVPHALCQIVKNLMFDHIGTDFNGEDYSNGYKSAREVGEHLSKMLNQPDEYLNDIDTVQMLARHCYDSKDDSDSIRLPGKKDCRNEDVIIVTKRLIATLPRKDITHHHKVYMNSFHGEDAVSSFMKLYGISKEDAIKTGNILVSRRILHPLGKNKMFDASKSSLYRLQPFNEPGILNNFRQNINASCCSDSSFCAQALTARLSTLMIKILLWATDQRGTIDYTCAKENYLYYKYQNESCNLHCVDMFAMSESDRLAFSINLFNLMVCDAYVRVGVPSNEKERRNFMKHVSYMVGDCVLSLSDLKHGIMRGNKPPTENPKETKATRAFSSSDSRRKLALQPESVDPRVHFAIDRVIGGVTPSASSSKSVWYAPVEHHFMGTDLDEDLQNAAMMFCEKTCNVQIVASKCALRLSSLFRMSSSDFAPCQSKLPEVIVKYLVGEKREMLQKMIDSASDKGKDITIKFLKAEEDYGDAGAFTSKPYDGKFYATDHRSWR